MSAKVQIDGAREMRKRLKKAGADMKDLKRVHAEAAEPVQREAERLVPKRSGALGKSIRIGGTQTGAAVRAGKKRVPYAAAIHFGVTKKKGRPANIRPQPFLFNAADRRAAEVEARYERLIGKKLDQAFR